MNLEFGRYLKYARQFEMPNFLDGSNIHKYLQGFKMNKRSYEIWNTCTNRKNDSVLEVALTSFGPIYIK